MKKHINMYQEDGISIYLGDSMEITPWIIQENSVDLIFTDPPYLKKYIKLYDWLGAEAGRILKPNRYLFAYSGAYWKAQIMKLLGKNLDYYFDFILRHLGNTSVLWQRRIISGYKSILCYSKGDMPKNHIMALGLFNGLGGDKRFHRWGQGAASIRYYISCFTEPGDLVFDPFLGGGTTAAVCKALGRRCIGIEIDKDAYQISIERVRRQGIPQEGAQLCLCE